MLLLYSSSISVSESDPGTLSAYAEEVASTGLCLRESSGDRAVVRVSTEFKFSSTSGADDSVVSVRGSDVANAAAYTLISTLCLYHTGVRSKLYTPDCDQPD